MSTNGSILIIHNGNPTPAGDLGWLIRKPTGEPEGLLSTTCPPMGKYPERVIALTEEDARREYTEGKTKAIKDHTFTLMDRQEACDIFRESIDAATKAVTEED